MASISNTLFEVSKNMLLDNKTLGQYCENIIQNYKQLYDKIQNSNIGTKTKEKILCGLNEEKKHMVIG